MGFLPPSVGHQSDDNCKWDRLENSIKYWQYWRKRLNIYAQVRKFLNLSLNERYVRKIQNKLTLDFFVITTKSGLVVRAGTVGAITVLHAVGLVDVLTTEPVGSDWDNFVSSHIRCSNYTGLDYTFNNCSSWIKLNTWTPGFWHLSLFNISQSPVAVGISWLVQAVQELVSGLHRMFPHWRSAEVSEFIKNRI